MATDAKSKREAVLINRQAKALLEPQEQKKFWIDKANYLRIVHPEKKENSTKKRMNWKISADHLSEKDSVWTKEKLLLETLKHNLDRGEVNKILKDYETRSEVRITKDNETIAHTNFRTIEIEQEIIKSLKEGRGAFKAINKGFDAHAYAKHRSYTKGQSEAFKLALTSEDFITGWVGVAGSGKSYALKDVKELAEEESIRVIGLGPDGITSRELEKSTGMQSMTIDKFLIKRKVDKGTPQLWVIDEAGKISSKKMLKVIRAAKEDGNVKILLSGDTRQIEAVEAGSPFSLLIKNKMNCAHLLEHRRQVDNELKEAVEFASSEKTIEQSLDKAIG
jgi:ATP-dependent exoDNAse (exonuclease V) alpha subunit